MAIDPVTAGLQLGAAVVTGSVAAVGDVISTTQLRRLDAANQKAHDDVQAFKDSLLARDLDAVNLRLGGLLGAVRVDVTDAECEQLRAITPSLDAFALLGLYCRGRDADLATERSQILQDTASVTAGGK